MRALSLKFKVTLFVTIGLSASLSAPATGAAYNSPAASMAAALRIQGTKILIGILLFDALCHAGRIPC